MIITPFEDLKVTTTVIVALLNNRLPLHDISRLLPVERLALNLKKTKKKIKIPHYHIPGSILSIRFDGMIRGVITGAGFFANTIILDIAIKEKNINIKLSPESIQIYGGRSEAQVHEAIGYIFKYITNIQKMINIFKEEQDLISWFKDNAIGNAVFRNIEMNTEHKYPTCIIDNLIDVSNPEMYQKFNKESVDFILSLCRDYYYHSDMCKLLEYIPTIPNFINEPLDFTVMRTDVINFNYKLGFLLDREKLNYYFNLDKSQGFISRYNNSLGNGVIVNLPCHHDETLYIRKKKKPSCHTFIVYRTGSITQSGPDMDLMKDAYYLFMDKIAEIKDLIIIKT